MGNSPPTGGLRLANSDYACVAKIAPSVAIEFSGRKVEQRGEGESTESWEMVYNLGTTKCYFDLSKSCKYSMSSPTPLDEELQITIMEGLHLRCILTLKRREDGLLNPVGWTMVQYTSHLQNRTNNANGEITLTHFFFYSGENYRSLFVKENKWRSKDKNPYMVTVTHYFVNTEDGNDAGLSMAVKKIRVSPNGSFDFVVDGPEKHPTSALLYMLDEVRRTNTWKPTYCYHCAEKIIQRQRARIWQTDTEDSDIEKVPATLFHRPRQNTGSLLANHGRFCGGNNNGNLNITNVFHR